MAKGVDANVLLDYIEFQIFPSQNRYEACICNGDIKETVTSGPLVQLLRHSDKVKTLMSDKCNGNIKLEPPQNLNSANWFNKSTLLRFLHIIGSSETSDTTNTVVNEISQLQEARKFHLSLNTKDQDNDTVSSDSSKNELLKAIDVRLTALKEELASTLNKAANATCSVNEIINLEKISHFLESTILRKTLLKIMEINEEDITDEYSSPEKKVLIPSKTGTRVIYGVSPAKVAELERQSSSESEEIFERSRTLVRSASPRRSSSPMRRVQIGRSGSRKSTPLTIKSLNYFPSRDKDKTVSMSDMEGSEEALRKSDSNVNRISVQDAISLFESKQKEQIVDIQKARSLLNASICANKSVLRKWSSGMGESSDKEGKEVDIDLPEDEKLLFSEVNIGEVNVSCESSQVNETEKLSSLDWNKQKEVELNELLKKMMETKPRKKIENSKNVEERGVLRTEKEKQILDDKKVKKPQKPSQLVNSRKTIQSGSLKKEKNSSIKEITKPSNVKTTTSLPKKPTTLPSATRKSWPSTPSPRVSVTTPGSTSKSTSKSTGPTLPVQSAPLASSRAKAKVETPQLKTKPLKASPSNVKGLTEKKDPKLVKTMNTTRTNKVHTSSEKPIISSKVTQKNMDSKPFLRKGSGITPPKKTKVPPQVNESLTKSIDLTLVNENETVLNSSDTVIEQPESDQIHTQTNTEIEVKNDKEISNDNSEIIEAEEEILISPKAWVEKVEDEILQIESPINDVQVKKPSPRIRHSLSQMLLEENSKEGDVTELTELTQSIIYQKEDSPKGLKRLLKFARKSKTDASSDGEDDGKETKALPKKNGDSSVKKASVRVKNDGLYKNGQGNTSNQRLVRKVQEGNVSASVNTPKASRSFFSLSAFKGGKQNETKFR